MIQLMFKKFKIYRLTDVVDGAVVAAEDEEGAGGVVAADGNHVLVLSREHCAVIRRKARGFWDIKQSECSTHLPVFGHSIPDPDLPGVTGGN